MSGIASWMLYLLIALSRIYYTCVRRKQTINWANTLNGIFMIQVRSIHKQILTQFYANNFQYNVNIHIIVFNTLNHYLCILAYHLPFISHTTYSIHNVIYMYLYLFICQYQQLHTYIQFHNCISTISEPIGSFILFRP